MVYRSSTEGGYGVGVSTDHVDGSHTGRVDIPDAELLFRGHFARSGPDLVLTGEDGHRLVITGYFASEKHPDLVAPNGAHLSGNLVDLLAGSPTPGHYAQAKTTLPPEAIGKVEKVVGHVTLIHNGVAGPLHVGDPVYKTDVVETAANSSCGIAFPDGTALDLVNNTRMALNEYNFEANNSASNGAVFSLVEGTFAFVAGQVAHTGEGMKINTPVATMGIRGTVGLFRTEPTVINSNLGHVWSVFLHEDIDGSHHLGRIAFIDMDPTSPTFGQVFYLLDSSEYIAYLEPQGPGLAPHVRLEPITNSKIFEDRHLYDDLGQIINAFQTGTVNPESVPGSPGSGDNPSLLFNPLDLFLEGGGRSLFDSASSLTPGSGTPPQIIFGGNPIMG
jgi:FecR protein